MDKISRNKDAVTQRILETTQETERLKQELQNLIAAGIAGSKNYVSTSTSNIPLESTNKVQIIKSYDPKHSQHVKKPAEGTDPTKTKNEEQALSPKKSKTYNVHQAREYIKKQRDKRKEELKGKKTNSKVAVENRKEKLQELQQRASELVKKNLEAKRQRSKSRDRVPIQPSNESVIVGFNCAEKTKKHQLGKNPNLLYPPESTGMLGNKYSEATGNTKLSSDLNSSATALSKHSKPLQNLLSPPEPHYIPRREHSISKINKSTENIPKKKAPREQKIIVHSNVTLRNSDPIPPLEDEKIYPKETCQPSLKSISLKSSESSKQQSVSNIKRSNLTLRSKNEAESVVDPKVAIKDAPPDPTLHQSSEKYSKNESSMKKKNAISSSVNLDRSAPVPYQEDIQKPKTVTPEWLKDTIGQGDPYNFINTVKRQLKYVVNENKPFYVDVGVQGNLDDISEPKSGLYSKKSDLKSFISHKCLNLDPQTIEHIELDGRKRSFQFKDGPTITNRSIGSDYDSDTSKNIPSLSSESGTSLRRNAEFVKQSCALPQLKPLINAPPNLDTKKVDEMKLKKNMPFTDEEENTQKYSTLKVPLPEDVERIKKKLFTDSDCYTSDFIPTDLSKSRDSLISFNCAEKSPNRVPETRSENLNASPLKSISNSNSETGTIPKRYLERLNRTPQESERKSRSLNSGSEGDSQKQNLRSAEFYSLYSELHPSASDPELKIQDHDVAFFSNFECNCSEVASSSEKGKESQDIFTEIIKTKDSFTDLNHSQKSLSDEVSEKIKTVSSIKSSKISSSELYKSKSEQIVSRKQEKGILSKSESNIYGNKENLKELAFKKPKLSLNIRNKNGKSEEESVKQALMKNISIRSGDRTASGDMNNTNEIHLKFEAEIHLLNDFNQSLRHFWEIEKAFESLRSKNDSEMMTKKVLQNRDTQTSIVTKASTRTLSNPSDRSSSQISTINYSRGSGMDSALHSDREDNANLTKNSEILQEINSINRKNNSDISKRRKDKSEIFIDLTHRSDLNDVLNSVIFENTVLDNTSQEISSVVQLSQMDDITIGSRDFNDENLAIRNFAGMSLRMFDQLIKDEDARIENWKKIVKIREQALLDRTRGELIWLEMQKKQLIETGKMPEAASIKKKQRGILLKHQQEKHEMQRLKQMQKEASAKRKTLLKKEKNLIKNQFLTDNMLSKLKSSSSRERRERRLSGPLKVIQTTASVHSETSLSKGAVGTDQEVKSITSRSCSVMNVRSGTSDNLNSEVEPFKVTLARSRNMNAEAVSSMKQRLLMREHALAKRRKTVEELLQWHKKLLEEEKAIEDLESKVEKIISKIPSESNEEPSKQSTDLPKSISERATSELNPPSMSQLVLDRLLPSKENVSVKSKSVSSEITKNIPQEENLSEDSNKAVSSVNYSADFDVDSVPEVLPQNSDESSVSSISQLIDNFSKIEDNILNLGLVQKKQSVESEDQEVSSLKSEDVRTVSSVAEEIIQNEERSQNSSQSSQIASEIEIIKAPKETQNEERENLAEQIIIEEPSKHVSTDDEDKSRTNPVEIAEEKSSKKDSEEHTEVRENNSESLRTAQIESENADRTSSVFEELFSKEPFIEVISVNEPEIINVPDLSIKSSLGDDVNDEIHEERTTSSAEKEDEKRIELSADEVSKEISSEASTERGNLILSSPSKETPLEEDEAKEEDDSQKIFTENELENASVIILDDNHVTSQDISIVAEIHSIHEESKPSTSHQDSFTNNILLDAKEESLPSASYQSSDKEIETISAQIRSEEPLESATKDDASTSHQLHDIEDYTASNVDIPSTSNQTAEQASTSQVFSLKEDVSNFIEDQDHHNHSISTSNIIEDDLQSLRVVDEERQSSENKTDEEKAASLSIKASGSQIGSVCDDRNRSPTSISRGSPLGIQEPSVSEIRSVTTSRASLRSPECVATAVVSEKSLLGETSTISVPEEEKLLGVSACEEKSTDSKHEKTLKDLSKVSGSYKIESVEENLSEASISQGKLLSSDEKSKILSSKDNSEPSGSRNSKDISEALPSTSVTVKENASVDDLSVERSSIIDKSEISTSKSTILSQKSLPSEMPSSSISQEKSLTQSEKLDISSQQSDLTSNKSQIVSEKSDISSQKSSSSSEKSPKPSLDVKKRVQEILNEASPVARGDKSPRMQDLCVMTYDLMSPTQSPESSSPLEERNKSFSLGSEAEELLRKQLAIEQEIKLLTEQQQKEQVQQFYIREIPNKPPPPYTPPSKSKPPKTASIIPSSKEEIEQITEYSAKIIHKAYLSNNLDNIAISDNTLNLIAKNIDKGCYKYVFDLCKEVAIDHYSQFTVEAGPSWLQLEKKDVLAPSKPLDVKGLKKLMNKKLLELFGIEKQERRKENAIMKWSRKKRDHVDEVLVQEMQAQESSWTNFDRDELIVKDRITNEIMEMLLKETAQVLKKTVQKKSASQ